MQPEAVDLKKAGRAAGKAFQEDSFRNYMARKIDLQRKQFGNVPPPPPPAAQPKQQARSASSVSFDPAVENNETKPRKKRKMNMSSILHRLKRRHGGSNRASLKKKTPTTQEEPASSINGLDPSEGGSFLTQAAIPEPDETDTSERQSMDNDESEETAIETQRHTAASKHTHRPDLFFTGIVVIINGYTHPDAESLQRVLQRHGGTVERYETQLVTHVIAEHLSTAKAKIYAKQRKPTPVVYPSWIVECVEAQRLLPHGPFLIEEVRDLNAQPSVAHYFQRAPPPASEHETPPLRPEVVEQERYDVHAARDTATKSEESRCSNGENGKKSATVKLSQADYGKTISTETKPNAEAGAPATRKEIRNPYSAGGKSVVSKTGNSPRKVPVKSPPQTRQSPSRGWTDDKYINGRVRTVGTDPNFLETFFSESRLSFIGSFRQRACGKSTAPSAPESRDRDRPKNRYILHVDMDSFFAAVVLRNYPQYKDQPVAICHQGKSGPDGEVAKASTSECATCNYHARKHGIKKGMFVGSARALCPSLIVLPYDFAGYEEVSEQVSEICHKYAGENHGVVEAVSCDESYMEVYVEDASVVTKLAQDIRRDVVDTTQCTATIGIASNKFLAKVATDSVKPNGFRLATDHVNLLKDLQLRDLHGVGYRSRPKLAAEGFEKVQDVWDQGDSAEHELQSILGKQLGTKIYNFCHGRDDRPVKAAGRQTIGAEVS